jgi:hypothetical protein
VDAIIDEAVNSADPPLSDATWRGRVQEAARVALQGVAHDAPVHQVRHIVGAAVREVVAEFHAAKRAADDSAQRHPCKRHPYNRHPCNRHPYNRHPCNRHQLHRPNNSHSLSNNRTITLKPRERGGIVGGMAGNAAAGAVIGAGHSRREDRRANRRNKWRTGDLYPPLTLDGKGRRLSA